MKNISTVLIAKNAEATISLTLKSLIEFPEVIVLDTGSNDQTIEICKRFKNVRLFSSGFHGFGKAKNLAASLAKYDWIFSIDADEVVSEKLLEPIKNEQLENNKVYSIRRRNFYRNKRINYSGWGKEYVARLYNRKHTSFNEKLVHESIMHEKCKTEKLEGDLLHYSYLNISDFAMKRDLYSELFAIEYKGKKKSSPFIALVKSSFNLFNTYFTRFAFLDGYRGLLITISNAHVTFIKYLKLYEANMGYGMLNRSALLKGDIQLIAHDNIEQAEIISEISSNNTIKRKVDIEFVKNNLTILN